MDREQTGSHTRSKGGTARGGKRGGTTRGRGRIARSGTRRTIMEPDDESTESASASSMVQASDDIMDREQTGSHTRSKGGTARGGKRGGTSRGRGRIARSGTRRTIMEPDDESTESASASSMVQASDDSLADPEVIPIRGRGRGRTSRGARRTRAGRGRRMITDNDAMRLQQLRDNRRQRAEDLVTQLAEDQMRDILIRLSQEQPCVILDMIERVQLPDRPRQDDTDEPDDVPDWCVCQRCRDMPTDLEKVCCRMQPAHCHSTLPEMEHLVLDRYVLHIQQLYRQDILARNAEQEGNVNRCLRHAAYRQYVLWQHGRLGEGQRRVIPSCVVTRIRTSFPDQNNHYRGYVPGRLG